MRTRLGDRTEDGAVFVLTALSLLVLFVFAAFAVDLSNAWIERRNDQNAADIGALSGVQFTTGVGPSAAAAAAELEVRRITAQNLGVTDAEWDVCTDPAKPPEFGVDGPGTECVSFTDDFSIMRVRIPDQSVDTIFAGVIGIDTLTTSAFAHVEIVEELSGNVLPFGLPESAGDSAEVCLKDTGQAGGGTSVPAPPCDGPQEGNFGFLDFKRFQWPGGVPSPGCSSGYLAENISAGIDHFLETEAAKSTELHEFNATADDADGACPNTDGRPDRTDEQSGSTSGSFHQGLVDGAGPGFDGRLTKTPFATASVMGRQLDNTPLWEFIGSSLDFGGTLPASCDPGVIAAFVPTSHDGMRKCLEDYVDEGSSAVLFTVMDGPYSDDPKEYDLVESPRWAYVPLLHDDYADVPGNGPFIFIEFRPVFLQTVYGNCNAGGCDEFNPGESNTIASNKKAQALTAFQIPKKALPDSVNAREPGTEESVDYVLVR